MNGIGLALLLAGTAQAKSPIAEVICEPTERMHDKLERQFRAQQTASGMRGPEQMMEVWTSETGDWTMVVTYATGTSCIVAMGEHWFAHEQDNPARG
ncbi:MULTISPECIES: hypothetical protein [unclassified Ruegeria]|uniref:hypothetical protein n=1 Tax=unclassified Ruegeria TaxID=2625375 RepID=UPI0014882E4E|nr:MULTISPECIES: hypothetical protein [unclassified Ruegeria]